MRTFAIFLALLMSVAACITVPQETDPWKHWGPWEPEYLILHFPSGAVQVLCGGPVPGFEIWGCTYVGTNPCQIIMTAEPQLGTDHYRKVLEHEKAHCRGWKHGEPQPEGTI